MLFQYYKIANDFITDHIAVFIMSNLHTVFQMLLVIRRGGLREQGKCAMCLSVCLFLHVSVVDMVTMNRHYIANDDKEK